MSKLQSLKEWWATALCSKSHEVQGKVLKSIQAHSAPGGTAGAAHCWRYRVQDPGIPGSCPGTQLSLITGFSRVRVRIPQTPVSARGSMRRERKTNKKARVFTITRRKTSETAERRGIAFSSYLVCRPKVMPGWMATLPTGKWDDCQLRTGLFWEDFSFLLDSDSAVNGSGPRRTYRVGLLKEPEWPPFAGACRENKGLCKHHLISSPQ